MTTLINVIMGPLLSISAVDSIVTKLSWSNQQELIELVNRTGHEGYIRFIAASYCNEEPYLHPQEEMWIGWIQSDDTFTRMAGYIYAAHAAERYELEESELLNVISVDSLKINNWAVHDLASMYMYSNPIRSKELFFDLYRRNPNFTLSLYGVAFFTQDWDSAISLYSDYVSIYKEEFDVSKLIVYYASIGNVELIPPLMTCLKEGEVAFVLAKCQLLYVEGNYKSCIQEAMNFIKNVVYFEELHSLIGWSLIQMNEIELAHLSISEFHIESPCDQSVRDLYAYYNLIGDNRKGKDFLLKNSVDSAAVEKMDFLLSNITERRSNISDVDRINYLRSYVFSSDTSDMLPFLLRLWF